MASSSKAFLLLFLLQASILVDATRLRLSSGSSLASFLPDAGDGTIKIPLKKREISTDEVESFFERVSAAKEALKFSKHSNYSKAETPEYSDAFDLPTETLDLKNHRNGQYIGLVSITDSDNEFEVIFDTGSANMWINSRDCTQSTCLSKKQYDYTQSPTFIELGQPLKVQFGSGSLAGEINADNIWIGGLKVENQSFAMIQEEIGVLSIPYLDGLVGLAYPSMAAFDLNPIFDNIIQGQKLKRNVFSFYFDEKVEGSHLMLGGIDKSLIEEDIKYFPVVDKRYWMIEASAILVGGQDIGLCKEGCKLVIDSGTSVITSPGDDFDTLMSFFQTVDCVNEEIPDIKFVLKNGYTNPFNQTEGQEVAYSMIDEDYITNYRAFGGHRGCNPGFMPLDIPEPHGPAWILGDTFLTKFVSVYDRDNDLVGFAKAKSSVN